MNPAWIQVLLTFASITLVIVSYIFFAGRLTGQHQQAREALVKELADIRAAVSKLTEGHERIAERQSKVEERVAAFTGVANGVKYRPEET